MQINIEKIRCKNKNRFYFLTSIQMSVGTDKIYFSIELYKSTVLSWSYNLYCTM